MIINLWMRFHNNSRLCSIQASSPRSFGAYDVAVPVKFLCVLPEIPNVSVPILCEIVKCILLQDATQKDSVVDYPAGHSGYDYCVVRNRELISLLTAFPVSPVNKSNARRQREKRIVDCNREIPWIDFVRRVSCARDCPIQCRQHKCSRKSSCWPLLFHIHPLSS